MKVDFHIHSNYSDGKSGIEEIARRAKERGLRAIAIVDHSIELRHGMDERKAKIRDAEIENAASIYGLKIYSGIECGIDASGNLMIPDYDFDLVIASVHEFVTGRDYYNRIMSCLERYEVDVLGHPFSPLFGFDGRNPELEKKLLDLIEEKGVAIELNSFHKTLFDDFFILCGERGIPYSIGSDAHELSRVGEVSWSVEKAKRYMAKAKLFHP